MNDNDIEREIIEKGKTAPRVTPDGIKAAIIGEYYFSGMDGAVRSFEASDSPSPYQHAVELSLLTFCVLVLRNGFTVTGESACASPDNFDAEIVRKIARQNAIAKIWPLEGYLLKQRLHDAA
ncbi:Gp49 family protein [Burkholderia gladioli]|uniref:Gp49 family protein n=1 Tax=Burkholderia gladioli TaxID=28095 RepID=UPI0016410DF5|nr:Gp49 family protein [Burkholderia gladioli]